MIQSLAESVKIRVFEERWGFIFPAKTSQIKLIIVTSGKGDQRKHDLIYHVDIVSVVIIAGCVIQSLAEWKSRPLDPKTKKNK